MSIIKKLMMINVILSLISTYSIGSETSFEDLPEPLQVDVLLKARSDLAEWLLGRMINMAKPMLQMRVGKSNCLAITPDSKKLITGSDDNTAIIWDIETGKQLAKLQGHDADINRLAITPDGEKVITGAKDKTAIIWDIATGEQLAKLQGHNGSIKCLAITPDGEKVITGSMDKTAIIWDIATGEQLAKLQEYKREIMELAITPDGKKVITGFFDKTAIIWDIESGGLIKELREYKGYYDAWIEDLAITPDGKKLIVGIEGGLVIIWDIEKGFQLVKLEVHESCANCLAITPDGKKLITAAEDNSAKIWDIETGKEIKKLVAPAEGEKPIKKIQFRGLSYALEGFHPERLTEFMELYNRKRISCCAITPDGEKVITGSSDKRAIIWDINTGKLIAMLEGHNGPVWHLSITPDGKKVITLSSDGTVRVWNLSKDQLSSVLGDGLTFKQYKIIEWTYKRSQENKKLRLPEKGESKKAFDELPELIKSLISDYVEIISDSVKVTTQPEKK